MADWEFSDFVSAAGVNQIAKWIRKDLSIQEASDLEALLTILQRQAIWDNHRDYKALSGAKYQGLGEIRLPGDQRIPIRLIGFRDPDARIQRFTFLIGCRHKGRNYDPPDALNTAVKRKKDLDNARGNICEHGHEPDETAEEG